ncbi:MAG: mucoidy inhibitor MuiA family protein [Prevotellaceae bacterium]|jgi:hypothetical protein|nr:mucoidy inhibitor MuiA family protein [Prevotellaceae bacterium]
MTTKRNLITVLLMMTFATQGFSDNEKIVKAVLKDATVFFTGAELTHTASAALVHGENEITIEEISPILNRNSLQIKISDGVIVSSFEYSINYLAPERKNDVTKNLQDSILFYSNELEKVEIDIKVNTEMLNILKQGITHNITVPEKSISIEELNSNIDNFQKKSLEFNKAISKSEKSKQKIKEQVARLQAQLKQEQTKSGKDAGILRLKLNSPLTVNAKITIKYFTTSASWTPFYDINIISSDAPINLTTKARVRQNTGFDWNKVKLSLSTGMPSSGKTAPVFNAWFLREQTYASYKSKPEMDMAQNSISYETQSLKESNVIGYGTLKRSQRQEPIYVVNGVVVDKEAAMSISPDQISSKNELTGESATSVYGAQAAGGVIVITTKTIEDYVSQDENQLSRTFSIDLPYTITGNGKEQVIELEKQVTTNVSYKYYCAPKLDKETFLIAEISDWEKLNLMSGQANVTYDGTYIGQTAVDAASTNKKLTLTLGTDKRVSVKREKMQDFSSVKFLGTDTKVSLAYKITVRNNQNKDVWMILKDQYPLSTNKNITVELLEKTTKPTTNREDIGVITWEGQLKAGETKEYFISYSAKYPKELNLNL